MKAMIEEGLVEARRGTGRTPRGSGPRRTRATCPVCGFAARVWVEDPDELPCAVVTEIERRYAGWVPARGICRQCALELEPVAFAGVPVR